MGSKKWIFRPEMGENKLSVVQLIQGEIVNKEHRFYKECIFKLEMKQEENIVSRMYIKIVEQPSKLHFLVRIFGFLLKLCMFTKA